MLTLRASARRYPVISISCCSVIYQQEISYSRLGLRIEQLCCRHDAVRRDLNSSKEGKRNSKCLQHEEKNGRAEKRDLRKAVSQSFPSTNLSAKKKKKKKKKKKFNTLGHIGLSSQRVSIQVEDCLFYLFFIVQSSWLISSCSRVRWATHSSKLSISQTRLEIASRRSKMVSMTCRNLGKWSNCPVSCLSSMFDLAVSLGYRSLIIQQKQQAGSERNQ